MTDLRARREALVREHMASENVHDFDMFEGDSLVGERVSLDQLTIMRQLGPAHDPASVAGRPSTLVSHPVTIGRTRLKSVTSRSR